MQTSRYLSLAVATALTFILSHAHAYSWTATRIPGLSGNYPGHVTDINNVGQIVGYASVAGGGNHAFLYQPGVMMKDLGTASGGRSSRANAINDFGQIVGWSETGELDSVGSPVIRSYAYQNGTTRLLPDMSAPSAINNNGLIAGGKQYRYRAAVMDGWSGQMVWQDTRSGVEMSHAAAINDSGQVAGTENYFLGDDGHAFYHDIASGISTRIATPGYSFSSASAINNAGRVVGTASNHRDSRAFVYFNGTTTLYDSPYGFGSNASDINNLGEIAGAIELTRYGEESGMWHAFFYGADGLVDLNDGLILPEGEYLAGVIGMNDRQDIVAFSNLGHQWLLTTTPIPEPETWALMLGGVGLGTVSRLRGRKTSPAFRPA